MNVLAVPGGGSSARSYFPELADRLHGRAELLELDAPGHNVEAGRQWLRLSDHARFLADAVRGSGNDRVLVVGHSLGALVALRLALDSRALVAGLLLLDPSPPIFGLLLPRPLLRPVGVLRRSFRRPPRKPVPQPRDIPLPTRVRWYMGATFPLSADLAAADLGGLPVVVVSAGEHRPTSVFRRTHELLVEAIAGARHEVWPNTTHGLATEQPAEVAARVLALLDRVGAQEVEPE